METTRSVQKHAIKSAQHICIHTTRPTGINIAHWNVHRVSSKGFPAMRYLLTVASTALALQAMSMTTTHADTVSQKAEQTDKNYWVDCADEGDHCYPGTDVLVTMRYGHNNNYTYIIAKGLDRISCNNFWGNPDDGANKSCAFTLGNPFDVAPSDTYVDIANQGENFILPVDPNAPYKMYWVRYGSGDRWMYTVMAADGAESMACTNDYFDYNPADGTEKVCQYSESAYYTLSDFDTLIECATEGQDCLPIGASAVILMRYGIENKYDWRFVHRSSGSYPCNNEFFNPNPIHQDKRCYWGDRRAGRNFYGRQLAQSRILLRSGLPDLPNGFSGYQPHKYVGHISKLERHCY